MTTTKEVRFIRLTRDYEALWNGQPIGAFETSHEAEAELDRLEFEMLTHTPEAQASEA